LTDATEIKGSMARGWAPRIHICFVRFFDVTETRELNMGIIGAEDWRWHILTEPKDNSWSVLGRLL
jgi:hypothetical protein